MTEIFHIGQKVKYHRLFYHTPYELEFYFGKIGVIKEWRYIIKSIMPISIVEFSAYTRLWLFYYELKILNQ